MLDCLSSHQPVPCAWPFTKISPRRQAFLTLVLVGKWTLNIIDATLDSCAGGCTVG